MTKQISGIEFKEMLGYGAAWLELHKREINELNVFPVPDGDTGTNMVRTIKSGLLALTEEDTALPVINSKFSAAVTMNARGNSGVILSQFLRGLTETFDGNPYFDCKTFIEALRRGTERAYASVQVPVEGTILTVARESTEAVEAAGDLLPSLDSVISLFIETAKTSLANTPNLLPVLKEAGVVDSGAAGLIFIFEGFEKYLKHEALELPAMGHNAEEPLPNVDFSVFTPESRFEFGYCTEVLLQLTNDKKPLFFDSFRGRLAKLGESVVITQEEDKIKIHIHTKTPEQVLSFCHQYGEFLTLKIENMTVQHHETAMAKTPEIKECGQIAVVAVAPDRSIAELFTQMGADAIIETTANPSSKDFLDAFSSLRADSFLVFPNSSNSTLSAIQASKLVKDAKVYVLHSKSIADCYSALPLIDFETEDVEAMVTEINESLSSVYTLTVSAAARDARFGGKEIKRGQFVALHGVTPVCLSLIHI